MTAIERTAYPAFHTNAINQKELDQFYTPTPSELQFFKNKLRRQSKSASHLATHPVL